MDKCPWVTRYTTYWQDTIHYDADRCALDNDNICLLECDKPCKIYDEELKKDAV